MPLRVLRDRRQIEAFLRQAPALHLYELGDLDDFFWHQTLWYGFPSRGPLEQVIMLYLAASPVLLAFTEGDKLCFFKDALRQLRPFLPRRFYGHFSVGLTEELEGFAVEDKGLYARMALVNRACIEPTRSLQTKSLEPSHGAELRDFYRINYASNWFDARMLDTGKYWGLWEAGELSAVAGVHVYSEAMSVAALGNIATKIDKRGRGFAREVTAALCRDLANIELIGLNVKVSNDAARRCYRSLGFEDVALYQEALVEVL